MSKQDPANSSQPEPKQTAEIKRNILSQLCNLGVIKVMSVMSKQDPANSSQPEPKQTAEIKRNILSTGLEDYGFWSQEMARQKAQQTEPDKPFRRGRIWC